MSGQPPAEPNGEQRTDDGAPERPRRQTAVALSYHMGEDELPRVVASGRGVLADKILDLAFQNGVAVREDPDLAELLATVDLDCEIPPEAIMAVAEILAYLYRLNGTLGPARQDAGD